MRDDFIDRRRDLGRLIEPGADDDAEFPLDDEAQLVALLGDDDELAAEEAAIHLADDPRMGDLGGGYLD